MDKFKQTISRLGILIILFGALAYIGFNTFNEPNLSVEAQPKYSEVRIFAVNEYDTKRMSDVGLMIDHANTKLGHYMDAWLSEYEINLLQKSGVPYQILVDDWMTYYENSKLATDQPVTPPVIGTSAPITHSIFGTMGGYLTYNEVVNKLDTMRLEYPQFISTKFSVGTTYEGRTQWAVRITNGPNAPTGRPEVLYHALIHAREPESMETQMYYFYWLFENYNTNSTARYILNNREIYWIPVFNPDGYVYNQTTNPNGGGMWRANRHISTGQCGAVDPNRNFGTYQFWNSTNNGSSTDSCNGGAGTYRGRSPFSELETRNVMTFVNSRNFNAAFSAHTYGNYIIKPWAWSDPAVTPDDNKFVQFMTDMRATNNYTIGTPSQTVGYMVRGGTDDWYYNDSVHTGHHIFSMTPETGTSFWPPQNQIIPLAEGMLFSNQYLSLIAGPYVNPLSTTFNQPNYTPSSSGTFKVVFRNKGLLAANNVRVIWTSNNAQVTIPVTQFNYSSLASFQTDSSTFNFTLASTAPNNCAITTTLTIKLDTTTIYTAPAYILVGTGTIVLNDQANNISNWTPTGAWGVSTVQSFSAPSSFSESPTGNYGNNINTNITLTAPINTSATPVTFLSFYHRYVTEAGFDFCLVEVSSDNGTTWQTVKSYDGTLSTWTQQTIDITSYLGGSTQAKVRFRFTSDAGLVFDGWYVDDIKITSYCGTLTGIIGNGQIPNRFALEQNYPNPFNPSTNIKFAIAKQSFVKLTVFDLLGRVVTTLVNEKKDAGNYEINFDASNLATGMYFYKLEAGDFVETKKMVLVK